MSTTYVTMANLTRYDGNLKAYIDSAKTKAIKAIEVKDNAINFYANPTPDATTTPDFTVDMPVEYFLDQAKTTMVQEFAWSEATYAGSTNPNLDGKPVLVLAVKGDDDSVVYSFLNMETLIDVYVGEGTQSVVLEVSEDNKISANVKVSTEEGNIISIKEDGLFASVTEVDISGKADKLVNPESGDPVVKAGQILVDDGNGNLAATGKTIAELVEEIHAEYVSMSDDEIDSLFA